MAQKENGQAQTPQTAQKDTLAATSEGLAGIAIGGVGYVEVEGEEIFVHQNALYEANGSRPYEGQQALNHVRYATKGPEALNVELIEPAGPSLRESKEH